MRKLVTALLERLRVRLRAWLDGDGPNVLLVRENGQQVKREALKAVGMMLQIQLKQGVQIIGPGHAVDTKEFWRVWKRLNKQKFTWEDGSKFNPGV